MWNDVVLQYVIHDIQSLYTGNRLVKSYMRIGIQLDSNILGTGVIGIAQLDFLKVTNNKQDFQKNELYFENL